MKRTPIRRISATFIALCCFSILCFLPLQNVSGALITNPSDAAFTGATLINFDDQSVACYTCPPGITIGPVNFNTPPRCLWINDTYADYSGDREIINGSTSWTSITFTFSEPISAFGFNFSRVNYTWRLEAFNASDVSLESYDFSSNGFYGIANSGIAYATLTEITFPPSMNDYIKIDDFQVTVVPVPGAVWLLGSGLVGLLGMRKKFMK